MNSTTRTLTFTNISVYIWAAVFIAGNVILPQMFHAVGLGGKVFLPIMLFTLIGASRYGVTVGLLTAILSPLVSFAVTGMPEGAMLGSLIVKSLLIVAIISTWRGFRGSFSLLSIIALTTAVHIAGFAFAGLFFGGFAGAWADLIISWPGILVQLFAFWAVTRK